jgi:hypothetical protein
MDNPCHINYSHINTSDQAKSKGGKYAVKIAIKHAVMEI